jgi:hypothetical protein
MRTAASFIFFLLFITSCKHHDGNSKWKDAEFDPGIRTNPAYADLDKQKEIFDFDDDYKEDSLAKRTSGVAYYDDEKRDPRTDYYARFNICRTGYFNSDTLGISIGTNSGFGTRGFSILYFNQKFYTQPYYSDDDIYEGEVKPTYKIISRELILDKRDYKPGDSLYGRIEFKSIETSGNNSGRQHEGVGYFRAKIKKIDF